MRRGFILGGHSVITHEDGSVSLHWSKGMGSQWSADAVGAYAALRSLVEEAAAVLFFDGKRKVVLADGAALVVGADDPRPGWDLGSDASIDVLLAQEIRVRAERPNIDVRSADHGPGAADPR